MPPPIASYLDDNDPDIQAWFETCSDAHQQEAAAAAQEVFADDLPYSEDDDENE